MPINFLDLTPKAHSETVTLETASGPVEVELCGVPLSLLAEISKRYPAFARVVEGGAGSIIDASEAMPALIAAGLGHAGSSEYEAKVREFPAADIITMALTVVRLTFPQARAVPLPAGAVADGAAGQPLPPTSPPQLSN